MLEKMSLGAETKAISQQESREPIAKNVQKTGGDSLLGHSFS